MNELIDFSEIKLGTTEQTEITDFCNALNNNNNLSIKSINLYGSVVREHYRPGQSDINILIIAENLDIPSFKSSLDAIVRGRKSGIAPFFITEYNLRTSTDVFPIKFLAIKESYKLLFGTDILKELEISHKHLRFRCEQEIKNLLFRLRRHYIMGGGQGLNEMMAQMIISFLETLRIFLLISNENLPSFDNVISSASKSMKIDGTVLDKVKSLHDTNLSLPKDEAEKLYDQFMAIVNTVAKLTDDINK